VSVVFPWPIGNLTTVLVPTNHAGDGFQLATDHPGANDAGVYMIFPGERRFTMVRTPLSERFRLRVDGDVIRVEHLTWAWGMLAITIHYEITKKRTRSAATWQALGKAADQCDDRRP
jgi:hypothetical protein